MRSTRTSYREEPHPYDAANVNVDAAAPPDAHLADHHHHHHQPQHAPQHQHHQQHVYYDPGHYHYMPPQHPPQPMLPVEHHIHHAPPPHHQHQHHPPQQNHHHHHQHPHSVNHYQNNPHAQHAHTHHPQQHQHPADPVWPSPAGNDVYLHHVDTTDYHLHHTAPPPPLEDMIILPPPPAMVATAPAAAAAPATRRSRKAKKSKGAASAAATSSRKSSRKGDTTAAANTTTNNGTNAGAGDATYVLRIHEMLEDAEKEQQTHIVSWQPHGRAFRIHKEQEFVEQIMPRYFKAKIGSFRRWLRAWGFARMTEGKDRGAWYHRHFVRGVTSFCKGMTRQQMAHSMINWPPAGQVPDFYSAASQSFLSEQPERENHHHHHNPESLSDAVTISNQNQIPLAKNPRRLRGTILEDLRQMLDDAENEGLTHIVGWMSHGRAFKIHNKDLFQGLMSRYFKTAKVTHLSDTLRIWGFQRLKKMGRDKGCYYHKFFVRGDPSQSRHLPREQMKAAMNDWPPPEGEPDLYQAVIPPASTTVPHEATQAAGMVDATQATPDHANPNHETAGDEGGHPTNHQDTTFPSLPPDPELITTDHKEEAIDNNRGDGTYALRLYEMLEDAEREGHQHIVSWQPHGRAFRIHKEKEFVEQIMPRYFKAQMKSFLRWCRAWGFVRMTEGRDRGAWYHRYFVRGVTSHSRNMSRQQMFEVMKDWLPAGFLPNFYASGSGNILSETNQQPVKPAPNVTCKNVKRLRGTVPEDLRQMLEEAEEEGNAQLVSWLSHGRAFKVHDKAAFADHILPRYFKASKYTYFSDALRMWGWQRIKHGRDKGAYYHVLFVKGQPQLTRHLTRIQMKNSMTPWPPAEGEPNLYAPQENNMSQGQNPLATTTNVAMDATTEPFPVAVPSPSPAAPHGEGDFEDLDLKHSAHWQTATVV